MRVLVVILNKIFIMLQPINFFMIVNAIFNKIRWASIVVNGVRAVNLALVHTILDNAGKGGLHIPIFYCLL